MLNWVSVSRNLCINLGINYAMGTESIEFWGNTCLLDLKLNS